MAPRLSSASLDFMGRITLGESVGLSGGSLLDCWSYLEFIVCRSYARIFFLILTFTLILLLFCKHSSDNFDNFYVVCDDQQHPSSSQADFVPFISFVPHKHSPNSSLCL